MRIGRLFAILGVIVVACVIGLIVAGYWFNWSWTGFGPETTEPKQHAKTLWDWLQLLIIPFVLAFTALLFNLANTRTEQRIAAQRHEQDRQIAEQRYENDQLIALDKLREDLLQKYLDCMSDLLLKEGLRTSAVDAEVRNFARVRTITLLFQLDARRIGLVFGFLREARLMSNKGDSIVSLSQADLRKINFSQVNLSRVNLNGANLNGANLFGTNLLEANLSQANLSRANLIRANLSQADLSGANLSEANLSGASLYEANLTDEQLKKAASLKGAIMPDGSVHP